LETIVAGLQICESLYHRKNMKAELSQLIPRKLTANLQLLIVAKMFEFCRHVAMQESWFNIVVCKWFLYVNQKIICLMRFNCCFLDLSVKATNVL